MTRSTPEATRLRTRGLFGDDQAARGSLRLPGGSTTDAGVRRQAARGAGMAGQPSNTTYREAICRQINTKCSSVAQCRGAVMTLTDRQTRCLALLPLYVRPHLTSH